VGAALLPLIEDADAQVRLQLGCSLGEWRDERAAKALATLALKHANDPYLTAAVLSSLRSDNAGAVAGHLFADAGKDGPPAPLARAMLESAVSLEDPQLPSRTLRAVVESRDGPIANWRLAALAGH
jgi:HEAT repeat protein